MLVNDLKVLMRDRVEGAKGKKHRCEACGKTKYAGCTRKDCPYRGKKK
jgi:hypothetical protein